MQIRCGLVTSAAINSSLWVDELIAFWYVWKNLQIMAQIRIEGKVVSFTPGDHLYLVLVSDSNNEFVVRGGPQRDSFFDFGNIVTEPGVPIAASEDNRPVANRETIHGSRVVDLGGRDANDVWKTLQRSAVLIQAANINYDFLGPNSNSTIAAVLQDVGINVNGILPDTPGIDIYPGSGDALLDDYARIFTSDHASPNADILRGGTLADSFEGGGGNDSIDGAGGQDIAVFSGDCLEYNISRSNADTITITHARGSRADGTDTLTNIETARFSDGKELDLTLSEIHGCTELGFLRDFVTGTTQDTRVVFDMSRRGDTSYPIRVFVDGRVTTGNAFFNDFFYTLPAGESPQLIISASVAEVFGDVAFDFEVNVSVVSPLRQLVEFSDATAGGVLIGDRVDRRGGRWWGDPHLITFDNVSFDFQAEGEFILARATAGNPYELQGRFKALSSAVSVADAVATRIGSDVVTIEIDGNDGELRINGVETQLNNGTQINVGNGTISRSGRTLLIDHGNGDQTEVSVFANFLNASPKPAQTRNPGSFEGLLGNNNGTPADDFRLANGTVLLTPIPIDTLYGAFAESWTVAASERILPGVVTAFDAPDRIITVASLPATLRAQAEAVVAGYGITNELIREAAILDFALTGNVDFVEAAALTDAEFDPIVGTVAVDPVVNSVVIVTADLTTLVEEDPQARQATFTVLRGTTEGDLLVNYALTGFGVAPASAQDFVAGLTAGSVVIPDGEDAVTFQVKIVDDNIAEGIEAFDVAITLDPVQANNHEVLVSSLRLTIVDADVATSPTYTLKSSATELFEGDRLAVSIATTDVPFGTPLYWSLSGAGITSTDFSGGITTGTGAVGADGRYGFSTVIFVDSASDPNESLQIKFFSDEGRTTQVGDTLGVLIKELPVGNPTDSSDIIQGTSNDASAREIISGIPVSSSPRGKQSVDFLTGLEGPDTFVLGDAVGTFYDDGIAAQKGSGDLGVILDFSSGDLIQLHGSPADYKLSKGAYTGGGFTNMRGLYISQITPGSLDEVVGFINGASLDTLSLTSNDQFIYAF